MNMRRHRYKPPFNLKRMQCKENRIDKIERNLIREIKTNLVFQKEVEFYINQIYRMLNKI